MSNPHPRQFRRGFSLIEAVGASLVTAVLLVSAMGIAGGVAAGRKSLDDRSLGGEIAEGLVAEILATAYADPATPAAFGRDAGEVSGQKNTFDDVDDFDAHTEQTLFTGRNAATDGYVATVTVRRATLATPATEANVDTGLKRIQVTVKRRGRVVADRIVLKADAP